MMTLKQSFSILAMLFGLTFFNATAAQAIPVRVDTTYFASGTSDTSVVDLETSMFFEFSLVGSGFEAIQIDAFTLNFTNPFFLPTLASTPSDFFATFNNGSFVGFEGTTGLVIPSTSPSFNDTISFGSNFQLIHRFASTGRTDYGQIFSSGLIPLTQTTGVPEPGALALFGVGLLGIAAVARRRRKTA